MALNFKSCDQVDELKQSHCGDNLEGNCFQDDIYTYIHIYIYIYIYILQKNKRKQKSGISTLKWLDFTYCSNKRLLGIHFEQIWEKKQGKKNKKDSCQSTKCF